MAYVSNPWQDDEDEDGNQIIGGEGNQVIGTGQPQGGSAGTETPQLSRGVAGAQNNAMAAQSGTAQAKGSGSWTNLNQYLDSNRGAGKDMAQSIANTTQTQVGTFQKGVGDTENAAKTKIASGVTGERPDLVEAVKTDPISVRDSKRDDFNRIWNAEYKGPNSATDAAGEDLARLGNERDKIKQRVGMYDTEGGKQQLLKDMTNRGDYSRGENTLDSFLVQTDGGKTLADSRKATDGFDGSFSGLTDRLGNEISKGRQTTNNARDNLRNAVTGETGKVVDNLRGIKTQVDIDNAAKDATYSDIVSRLGKKDLKLANILGLDADSAQWALANGFDLSKLVEETRDLSLADRVDDGTISRLAALQDLQGSQDRTAGFDFGQRGGSTAAINKRQDLIDAAKQGRGIQNELNTKRDALNQQRNNEFGNAVTDAAIAQSIGMSPQEIAWLVGGGADQDTNYLRSQVDSNNWSDGAFGANKKNLFKDKGAYDERKVKAFYDNIRKEIQRNPFVNLGDVASGDQRQTMSQLAKLLGITGPQLMDTQDEGGAFKNFDVARYQGELNSKKSAYGRAESDHDAAVKAYMERLNRENDLRGGSSGDLQPIDVREDPRSMTAPRRNLQFSDSRKKSEIKDVKFGSLMKKLGRC